MSLSVMKVCHGVSDVTISDDSVSRVTVMSLSVMKVCHGVSDVTVSDDSVSRVTVMSLSVMKVSEWLCMTATTVN